MAEVAIGAAALEVVGPPARGFISRQFRYIFCYRSNIKKMNVQIKRLEARTEEVNSLVETAKNNCKDIGAGTVLWLKDVEDKNKKIGLVQKGIQNMKEGCLNEWCLHFQWCLHFLPRYRLSRKTTKETRHIAELLDRAKDLNVDFPPPPLGRVPPPPPPSNTEPAVLEGQEDAQSRTTPPTLGRAPPLPPSHSEPAVLEGQGDAQPGTTSTSPGSFGELTSRTKTLEGVMEAVGNVNIHIIGVCGMGGIGKTILIEKVVEKAKVEGLFDEIAFVTVSRNPDMKKIQRDIAELLGLELGEDRSLLAGAIKLRKRLNQKKSDGKPKRILIVLDDLWEKLDLKKVGIPSPDDGSGCKIVLAFRSIDVCHQMKAEPFHVELLLNDEAWSLFRSTLYPTISLTIGKDIVAECGGLPIAITTIASLLANKEVDVWEDVLRRLKTSSLTGPYREAYTVFQASYDHLEHQEGKDVFLLSCLFPEDSDIPIEDIARYGMGLKVFNNIRNLHDARVAARACIKEIKNLNLLLRHSPVPGSVKMHDLVRDFSLSIASEGKFMVRFENGLEQWLAEDAQKQCTHISMQCDDTSELPTGLKYLSLKLMRLISRSYTFSFPENLPAALGEVQVLDLQFSIIPSFQIPITCLTNLRYLCLSKCSLFDVDISCIGNMTHLKLLNFSYSILEILPTEIGKLSQLRLLDVTECKLLWKINPGVLSGLTALEELYMRGTPTLWAEVNEEFGYTDDEEKSHAHFTEVEQLCNLVVLEIDIPYELRPVKIKLEKLKKFEITVKGISKKIHPRRELHNSLHLKGAKIYSQYGIFKALCRKVQYLYLRVDDLVNLRNEVDENDLTQLSTLICEECDELTSVFDRSFKIRSSPLLEPPFGNLRELELTSCGKLKNVCVPSVARNFINLEILKISNCSSIEEIISKEPGGDPDEQKPFEFLNLITLHLINLPNLVCFSKAGDHEVHLPRLRSARLDRLPKLSSVDPVLKVVISLANQHQKVSLNSMEVVSIYSMESITALS